MSDNVDDFLEHVGVKGMKWGVRRGSDGVRPIARTLNDSSFGKFAQKNVDRHNQNKYGTSKVTKKDSASSEKYFKNREKSKSAAKQRDVDIKAARQRINSGKNVAQKLMNRNSFGKPLGGRKMLTLMNKGSSSKDVALAASMTRGEKAAVGVIAGMSVAGVIALNR